MTILSILRVIALPSLHRVEFTVTTRILQPHAFCWCLTKTTRFGTGRAMYHVEFTLATVGFGTGIAELSRFRAGRAVLVVTVGRLDQIASCNAVTIYACNCRGDEEKGWNMHFSGTRVTFQECRIFRSVIFKVWLFEDVYWIWTCCRSALYKILFSGRRSMMTWRHVWMLQFRFDGITSAGAKNEI